MLVTESDIGCLLIFLLAYGLLQCWSAYILAAAYLLDNILPAYG
jgi:hypothetical protein